MGLLGVTQRNTKGVRMNRLEQFRVDLDSLFMYVLFMTMYNIINV